MHRTPSLLLLLLLSACSDSDQGETSEINWHASCTDDSTCGDGKCICGVCTISCDKDSDCDEVGTDVICAAQKTAAYEHICQCRDEALTGICLPGCADDDSCNDGFSCTDGVCVLGGIVQESVRGDSDPFRDPEDLHYEEACSIVYADATGREIRRIVRSFDEDGNMLSEAEDMGYEVPYINTYEYDEDGELVRWQEDVHGDCDIDETWDIEGRTRSFEDAFGNVIREEYDENGDGKADSVTTYEYDEKCNNIRYAIDKGGDGTVERQATFTYDENGNELAMEVDEDGNGTVDERSEVENRYDEDGNLLAAEYNEDGDGKADPRLTFTYDKDGHRLSEERDQDGDGVAETQYTFDSDGHTLTAAEDRDGDGAIDLRRSFVYDEDGNLISQESDDDGDGIIDQAFRVTYDEGDRVMRRDSIDPEEGTVMGSGLYTYDEDGRVLTSENRSSEGDPRSTTTYAYECADMEMIECSVDRRPVVLTYDGVCVDPIEEGVQPTGVGREADPVVLSGEALELLLGRDADDLVAFRYKDAWEQVPLQVDERKMTNFVDVYNGECDIDVRVALAPDFGVLVYSDEDTNVGADPDPHIDSDDEIVMMLKDSGDRPDAFTEPEGVIADSGVEVAVLANEGEPIGFFYLFTQDGSLVSDAGRSYGGYTYSLEAGVYPDDFGFCRGPNPEDSWFRSDFYQRHFSDRWVSDVVRITAPGATGADILDMQHSSAYDEYSCGVFSYSSNEGAFVNNKPGPVRSIRSYVGANSGPLVQRTHLFYEQREDIITDVRAHPMPEASVFNFLDYSAEAEGMTYVDCYNLGGVDIDGQKDDIELGRINILARGGNESWRLVTGEQGSLVHVTTIETNIDFDLLTYYQDNASPGSSPCGSDDVWYGASGVVIESELPCTDAGCDFYLQDRVTTYYLEPDINAADALQLSQRLFQPLEIMVQVAGSQGDL